VHNSDSFIEEVSEAVRRDRLTAGLRRYGWAIGTLIVLLVGGAAVNEWLKAHNSATAAVEGDALRAALAETDAKTRDGMLADIAAKGSGAAVLARLAEAGSLADAGDADGAAALLEQVAGDGGTSPIYRSLASLEKVMVLGDKMDAGERAATLELLTAPGAPFRPLGLEQRALMQLEKGDKAAAQADLQAILDDPAATQSLQARARQLIIASGGSIVEPTPPAAPVPADG
jgi:hypothetical protein